MRLLIAFLLFVFSSTLFGQELPPIKNYTPKEYNGEFQNWGVTQSPSKNIYVANHTSLLEFDGSKWHQYKLPTSPVIRSVKAIGDKIYTGSYREFGYWTKNPNGELTYTSLSQKMETSITEDEEFWEIVTLDQWVLFQSLDRIYIYDKIEDSFKIIEAKSDKANMGIVNNNVYFQIAREGLFTCRIWYSAPRVMKALKRRLMSGKASPQAPNTKPFTGSKLRTLAETSPTAPSLVSQ